MTNEPLDLDDIESRISTGIYGDDRMTEKGRSDAFAALSALVAEVERLREVNADLRLMVDGLETAAHEERAAVVAYLRGLADDYGVCIDLSLAEQADIIERGEHRREEKP